MAGKTEVMIEREKRIGGEWKDEGDGYFSLIGNGVMGALVYVALPVGHPDVGVDYNNLKPEVNGGLTFGGGNVFGWDYAHFENEGTPEEDIVHALNYFRGRE